MSAIDQKEIPYLDCEQHNNILSASCARELTIFNFGTELKDPEFLELLFEFDGTPTRRLRICKIHPSSIDVQQFAQYEGGINYDNKYFIMITPMNNAKYTRRKRDNSVPKIYYDKEDRGLIIPSYVRVALVIKIYADPNIFIGYQKLSEEGAPNMTIRIHTYSKVIRTIDFHPSILVKYDSEKLFNDAIINRMVDYFGSHERMRRHLGGTSDDEWKGWYWGIIGRDNAKQLLLMTKPASLMRFGTDNNFMVLHMITESNEEYKYSVLYNKDKDEFCITLKNQGYGEQDISIIGKTFNEIFKAMKIRHKFMPYFLYRKNTISYDVCKMVDEDLDVNVMYVQVSYRENIAGMNLDELQE